MITIDLNRIKTKEEFHKKIKESLKLPEYYGNNLDALHDVLGEISESLEIEFLWNPSQAQGFGNEDEGLGMNKLVKGLKSLTEDIQEECENITIRWKTGGKMEFRDLKKQYQVLKEDIDKAIEKVNTNCNFISGKEVEELEHRLAEYVGAKYCVSCANGTDALSIAMMTLGIGHGDGVFVPDFTFFASGEIVSHCGATPVFVDVEERTFNIDIQSLRNAIQKVKEEGILTPKAIVAVDLFGLPANLPELKELAEKEGMYLIEDGAQGFGGVINKDGIRKVACSFGDISTTSFFPAKPLGCYGDGGALFTDNEEWAELMKSIRVHGKGAMKYDNIRIGLNSRLDTIQAAVLSVKLDAFEKYELSDVNKAAETYDRLFEEVFGGIDEEKIVRKNSKSIKLPLIPQGYYSSWAQYTLIMDNKEERDGLQSFLKENEIPTMVYYPKPMHKQLAFNLGDDYPFSCQVTEDLCERVVSLPIHPYLTEEDAKKVVECIHRYL